MDIGIDIGIEGDRVVQYGLDSNGRRWVIWRCDRSVSEEKEKTCNIHEKSKTYRHGDDSSRKGVEKHPDWVRLGDRRVDFIEGINGGRIVGRRSGVSCGQNYKFREDTKGLQTKPDGGRGNYIHSRNPVPGVDRGGGHRRNMFRLSDRRAGRVFITGSLVCV